MPRLRLEKRRPGGISPFSRHSGATEGSYKLIVHPVDPRTGARNNLTTALTRSFRALCTEKQNLTSLLFLNPLLALDNREDTQILWKIVQERVDWEEPDWWGTLHFAPITQPPLSAGSPKPRLPPRILTRSLSL